MDSIFRKAGAACEWYGCGWLVRVAAVALTQSYTVIYGNHHQLDTQLSLFFLTANRRRRWAMGGLLATSICFALASAGAPILSRELFERGVCVALVRILGPHESAPKSRTIHYHLISADDQFNQSLKILLKRYLA